MFAGGIPRAPRQRHFSAACQFRLYQKVSAKRDVLNDKSPNRNLMGRRDQFEDEATAENEDDIRVAAQDFERLLIAPGDWTVSTIYDLIGKLLQLDPAYHRRNVWQVKAKSQFIESLLFGIPIPQILIASKEGQKNSFLVLDGKQRLSTIK